MYTVEELRNRLPKVGDLVFRKPVLYRTDPKKVKKRLARVVYVHDKNLWYTVEFNINGYKIRQGYNLLDQIKCKSMNNSKSDVFNPDDKSSIPHRVPKKTNNSDKLNNITHDLEVYNREHDTILTYGAYVHMLEEQQKKLLRSKKNVGK